MRKLVILFAALFPILSLADTTITCPTNGHFLEIGSSVEDATITCGNPASARSYTKSANVSEELVYYKRGINNTNDKITILFNHGKVVNINVIATVKDCDPAIQQSRNCDSISSNTNSSNACGQQIGVGGDIESVQSICGAPATHKTIEASSTNMTELTYQGTGENKLVFEEGKLVDSTN